jgi:hypothetical protein
MTFEDREGDRPVRFRWRLEFPLPLDIFHFAKVTAG